MLVITSRKKGRFDQLIGHGTEGQQWDIGMIQIGPGSTKPFTRCIADKPFVSIFGCGPVSRLTCTHVGSDDLSIHAFVPASELPD
jgi:hypothetical protein